MKSFHCRVNATLVLCLSATISSAVFGAPVDRSRVTQFVASAIRAIRRKTEYSPVLLDVGHCLDAPPQETASVLTLEQKTFWRQNMSEIALLLSYKRTSTKPRVYLALDCSPYKKSNEFRQTRNMVTSIHPPFSKLIFFHIAGVSEAPITFFRSAKLMFMLVRVLVPEESSSECILILLQNPEGVDFNRFLNMHIATPMGKPKPTSLDELSALVTEERLLTVKSFRTSGGTSIRHMLSCIVILKNERKPNVTTYVKFSHSYSWKNDITSHVMKVQQYRLIAFALIPPKTGLSLLRTVPTGIPIPFMVCAASTSALIYFGGNYRISTVVFLLFASLFVVVEWPKTKSAVNMCTTGSWLVGMMIIAVVLRASIVARMHGLPDTHFKGVDCMKEGDFDLMAANENIGMIAGDNPAKLLIRNLPYFFRKGILCQTRRNVYALHKRLLHKVKTYEMPVRNLRFSVILATVKSVEIANEPARDEKSSSSIHMDLLEPPILIGIRVAQLELSFKLIRGQSASPYENLAKAAHTYFRRRLKPQYKLRNCSRIPSTADPTGTWRCIEPSELDGDKRAENILEFDDLKFSFEFFVNCLTLVCFITVIEICLCRCRVFANFIQKRTYMVKHFNVASKRKCRRRRVAFFK